MSYSTSIHSVIREACTYATPRLTKLVVCTEQSIYRINSIPGPFIVYVWHTGTSWSQLPDSLMITSPETRKRLLSFHPTTIICIIIIIGRHVCTLSALPAHLIGGMSETPVPRQPIGSLAPLLIKVSL